MNLSPRLPTDRVSCRTPLLDHFNDDSDSDEVIPAPSLRGIIRTSTRTPTFNRPVTPSAVNPVESCTPTVSRPNSVRFAGQPVRFGPRTPVGIPTSSHTSRTPVGFPASSHTPRGVLLPSPMTRICPLETAADVSNECSLGPAPSVREETLVAFNGISCMISRPTTPASEGFTPNEQLSFALMNAMDDQTSIASQEIAGIMDRGNGCIWKATFAD